MTIAMYALGQIGIGILTMGIWLQDVGAIFFGALTSLICNIQVIGELNK